MSWLAALEKVSQRAALRASQRTSNASSSSVSLSSISGLTSRLAPPAAAGYRNPDEVKQEATRIVNSAKGVKTTTTTTRGEANEYNEEMEMAISSSTKTLHHVSDTWRGALQVMQFSQLDSTTNIEMRLCELPLSLAAESVAILLQAGKGTMAVDVLNTWKYPKRYIRMRSKLRATRHLQRALKTLGVIGDVETLRSVISILHRELLEQKRQGQHRDNNNNNNNNDSNNNNSNNNTSTEVGGEREEEVLTERRGLFSALGTQRTRVLLVKAVHQLIVQDDSVVPVYEKLTWINAVAIATTTRTTTTIEEGIQTSCLIPFELQEDFHRVVEQSPLYDVRLLPQVGPAFACGFRQPTQCTPAEILSIPRSEMRRLYTQKQLIPIRDEWIELEGGLLSHSPCIRYANETTLLLHLLCTRYVRNVDAKENKKEKEKEKEAIYRLRRYFITQLQSPRSSSRRLWSRMLLRHTSLLCHIGISPIMVFSTCALTFHSFHVHPIFSRCCLSLLRRLQRMNRTADAARVVWNHLSVVHYSHALLFAKHPIAFESVIYIASCAMRDGVGGRREAWMGHRSIALLRAASTTIPIMKRTIKERKVKGKRRKITERKITEREREEGNGSLGIVTPAHCIPICAAALDCGVHFATVQQFIRELFKDDDSHTALWVINMVRLHANSHISRICIPLECASHSAQLRSVLRQYAYYDSHTIGPAAMVEVHIPSRNKLLALWSMLNDDTMSIPLRRLICRYFLDETNAVTIRREGNGKSCSVQHVVHELFREEVLASIASNCTTESSFIICMDALIAQRRLRNAQQRVELLQLSEMNDNTNVDNHSASFSVSG